jgi:hypothetical protein
MYKKYKIHKKKKEMKLTDNKAKYGNSQKLNLSSLIIAMDKTKLIY